MDINKPTTFETLLDDQNHEYFAVDNAKLIWTNLAGRENTFNREGKRNFVWVIPDMELAQQLAAIGFNIKHQSVRDGFDGEEFDHMKIDISYETDKGQPIEEINPEWLPKVYLVDDEDCATLISKEGLGELDGKSILYAYFEFRAYNWEFNKKSGVSAKLKRLFLKIKKDPLAGRFKFRDSEAIHPNDYTVLRSQEIKDAEHQVPGGDDLPFEVP